MDVVVHASLEPEPLGLTVLEAMAAGKAVVAADSGGVRETVVADQTGLLYPTGDEEALADCEKSAELGADAVTAALVRAQVLLMANKTGDYRQACLAIVERFGQSEDPGVICHAARACVLAPKAVPDPMVPVKLAVRGVSGAPREWTLYTLAMAHLRAGQLDEASQRFHESLEVDPNWHARFLNWLGLALVHHESGQQEESQQWLDEAVELMKQHPAQTTQDRIEGQLLRREVEEMLGKPEQGKDATESEQ